MQEANKLALYVNANNGTRSKVSVYVEGDIDAMFNGIVLLLKGFNEFPILDGWSFSAIDQYGREHYNFVPQPQGGWLVD